MTQKVLEAPIVEAPPATGGIELLKQGYFKGPNPPCVPKTFDWFQYHVFLHNLGDQEEYCWLPRITPTADLMEVVPHLPNINLGLKTAVDTTAKRHGLKYWKEDVWPVPFELADLMAEQSMIRAFEHPRRKWAMGVETIPITEDDGLLFSDAGPVEEAVVFGRGVSYGVGLESGARYEFSEEERNRPSISRWAYGYVYAPGQPARIVRTPDEADVLRTMQNHVAETFYAAYITEESMAMFERREQVLERFTAMVAGTPEVQVIDVMPVHLHVAGTAWGHQRRGHTLLPKLTGASSASEGALYTYNAPAWLVGLRLGGSVLQGAVYCREDGRFLISTWCQREVTKDGLYEAYGGGAMGHTLLTWALGPGFHRASYGPNSARSHLALRPARLKEASAPVIKIGNEKAAAALAFLCGDAKSLTSDGANWKGVGPSTPWPALYCPKDSPLFNLGGNANRAEHILPGVDQKAQLRIDVMTPLNFVSVYGTVNATRVDIGGGNTLLVVGVQDASTGDMIKGAAVKRKKGAGGPEVYPELIYNYTLKDPEEAAMLMELLGVPLTDADVEAAAEWQKALAKPKTKE